MFPTAGEFGWKAAPPNTIGVAVNPQPITLNANTTIDTAASTMLTINSPIGGTGGITKINPGTLQLNGNNAYSGDTVVNAGTLQLGAANRIADSSNLVLGGGTFNARGFNETVGRLGVTAASTLDFGATPTTNTLHFANSSNLLWGLGATLTINNWTANPAGAAIGWWARSDFRRKQRFGISECRFEYRAVERHHLQRFCHRRPSY